MTETRKLRVFLCHSSQDKPIVRELYQRLNAEGWIDPWLDEEKLLPGQDWDIEIEKAIELADAVIVLLSSRSVTKEGYIQKELRYTIDVAFAKPLHTTFIIPIRLDECSVPRQFTAWQWLDYFPRQVVEKSYQRLLASLTLRAIDVGIETEKLKLLQSVAQKLWPDFKTSKSAVQEERGRVFISYSRNDIDFARLLATDLQRDGYDVWWDISNLQGGDNWVRSIQEALDKSQYCLVVVTPDGLKSPWVEREYTYAINNNLKVIPIFLKTCRIPFAFSTTQYIDFRQNRYSVSILELFVALNNRMSK